MSLDTQHIVGVESLEQLTIDIADLPGIHKAARAFNSFVKSPEEYARDQARDMVAHFQRFAAGEEDSFTRYFVIEDGHHNLIHTRFWEETNTTFGAPFVLDFPDKPVVQQMVFPDHKVCLISRTDYAHDPETGELKEFGVNYEAAYIPDVPCETIGKIATGLAMD